MDEFILKEREVKEKISEIVTESGLPAITLKPIFLELLQAIKIQEIQEYEQAKSNIEEKIKKEEENEKR